MLLQSMPEGITPLPALPSAWPEGYVKGLRTRTGETVDLAWKDGKVTRLEKRKTTGHRQKRRQEASMAVLLPRQTV
jgi:alpha-L-fucosidase 2